MFGLGLKKELILISLFALLALVSQSVRIVEAGRTGVVFNISGGVQKKPLKEGLHFLIPFVQSLIVFDTRLNSFSFTTKIEFSIEILLLLY